MRFGHFALVVADQPDPILQPNPMPAAVEKTVLLPVIVRTIINRFGSLSLYSRQVIRVNQTSEGLLASTKGIRRIAPLINVLADIGNRPTGGIAPADGNSGRMPGHLGQSLSL